MLAISLPSKSYLLNDFLLTWNLCTLVRSDLGLSQGHLGADIGPD